MSVNLARFSVGSISEILKTFIIYNDISSSVIPDPYSFVQSACFKAIEQNIDLRLVLDEDENFINFISSLSKENQAIYIEIVSNPENFTGTAAQTIHDICSK
jgi:hypothetical protein